MELADIIIVGGGVAGLSVAYELSLQGLSVTVFEKAGFLCAHGSGNPIALVNPHLAHHPGPKDEWLLAAFSEASTWLRGKGVEVGFIPSGALHIPVQKKHQGILTAIKSTPHQHVVVVTPEEATEKSGVTIPDEALFYPGSGTVRPLTLASFYSEQITRLGKIYLNEAATLQNKAEGFIVKTSQRTVAAPKVVFASAYEASSEPLLASLPLEPVRGEVMWVPETPVSKRLRLPIAFNGYVMPAENGFHLIGSTYDHGEFAVEPDEEKQQKLGERVCRGVPFLFPKNPVAQKLNGRVGFRAHSFDRLPYIGEIPHHSGLYVSLAHGSRGMQSSRKAATELTRLILKNIPVSPVVDVARAYQQKRV